MKKKMTQKLLFSTDLRVAAQKPNYAFLRLTSRCTGKCAFCNVWKTPEDASPHINWFAVGKQLASFGLAELNLHGGEIMLSRHIEALVSGLGKTTPLSATTNGSLLQSETLDYLVSNGLRRIFVSLDHHEDLKNSASRGNPDLKTSRILENACTGQEFLERPRNHCQSCSHTR